MSSARELAVVMPAFNEGHTLVDTARDLLDALAREGIVHRLVVVDDGSTDQTGPVADDLASSYPGRLTVVHHGVNLGLDAAIRTGVAAASETGEPWVLTAHVNGNRDPRIRRVHSRDLLRTYTLVPYIAVNGAAPTVDREGTTALLSPNPAVRDTGRHAPAAGLETPGQHLPEPPLGRTGTDPALRIVTLLATLTSTLAALYVASRGLTLAYPDALSHELIARRVVSSPTPGFGQLGGVWLPLTHVLMLPFVWSDALFYSGWAGTLISMAAFVVACRYLYRLGRDLGGSWVTGAVTAAVFALNPNVLYMQATAMSEVPMMAGMAASTYYLQRWCRTGHWSDLSFSSIAALAATLIRYEAWVFLLGEMLVVLYVSFRNRRTWRAPGRGVASLLFFGFIGGIGVAGWLAWNALIFRDPLNFQSGTYAKPSLWVGSGDEVIGNLTVAARTYAYAVYDNLGAPVVVAMLLGLVYYLARSRLRSDEAAPLALLPVAPFYIYALYAAQRPLQVPQITGHIYNIRFGLVQVLVAAIFVGYLSRLFVRRNRVLAAATLAAFLAVAVTSAPLLGPPVTVSEAISAQRSEESNQVAARWLNQHYDGGRVLMESFGNETVTFASRVPTSAIVYEGTNARGDEWSKALAAPRDLGVRWLYMRVTPGNEDLVAQRLGRSPVLEQYQLVYHDQNRRIYRLRDTVPGDQSEPTSERISS